MRTSQLSCARLRKHFNKVAASEKEGYQSPDLFRVFNQLVSSRYLMGVSSSDDRQGFVKATEQAHLPISSFPPRSVTRK